MKLYLFGGAELQLGHGPRLKELIKETILGLNPKTIVHVPFARLNPTEEDFKEGWFKELMKDSHIPILDARSKNDLKKAVDPVIFINGGHGRYDLINMINADSRLLHMIINAKCIVAESSGAKVLAEYQSGARGENKIIEGIGVLKNTIIEPHYTERGSQKLLAQEMKKSKMKYGIGIDCITGIVIDTEEFPDKWEKIGDGTVDVKVT